MSIYFVKPEKWMVESIAADMRQQDVEEVWASDHLTPIEALQLGWESSDLSAVAMCDGEPLVMFGLVKRDMLSGSGVIWMLGSNSALKYKKEFFIQTPKVLQEMMTICPFLYNMVHGRNSVSIQWLEWLGFTIEEPVPYGPDKELFHRFYMRRS